MPGKRRNAMRVLCVLLLTAWPTIVSAQPADTSRGSAPSALLGDFRDDYGSTYRVSATVFEHLPRAKYHIVSWHPAEHYLIARNDTNNVADKGLWTRIDWMPFEGMAPYTWGFCLTTYRAATEAEARATPPANRRAPRTGCNGFPFSRMQRAPQEPSDSVRR